MLGVGAGHAVAPDGQRPKGEVPVGAVVRHRHPDALLKPGEVVDAAAHDVGVGQLLTALNLGEGEHLDGVRILGGQVLGGAQGLLGPPGVQERERLAAGVAHVRGRAHAGRWTKKTVSQPSLRAGSSQRKRQRTLSDVSIRTRPRGESGSSHSRRSSSEQYAGDRHCRVCWAHMAEPVRAVCAGTRCRSLRSGRGEDPPGEEQSKSRKTRL